MTLKQTIKNAWTVVQFDKRYSFLSDKNAEGWIYQEFGLSLQNSKINIFAKLASFLGSLLIG